jgi:hypothetical protein
LREARTSAEVPEASVAFDELGVGRRGATVSRDAGEVNHRPRTRCSTECPQFGHSAPALNEARPRRGRATQCRTLRMADELDAAQDPLEAIVVRSLSKRRTMIRLPSPTSV